MKTEDYEKKVIKSNTNSITTAQQMRYVHAINVSMISNLGFHEM